MRHYLVLILLLFGTYVASAQTNLEKKLNKFYNDKAYYQYISTCSKLSMSDLKPEFLLKLADSYRKTGDTQNAERAYGILINKEDDPKYHFDYAQMLKRNGKYKDAKRHYLIYHEYMQQFIGQDIYDPRGAKLAKACDQISQFKAIGDIKITNASELNTEELDFSPAYYKDGIVFISTRPQRSSRIDDWTNSSFADLYVANYSKDSSLQNPSPFSVKLNSKYHEGPVSFCNDYKTVYFTRNNYLKGKKGKSTDDVVKLKVYKADMVAGFWSNIEELDFNHDNYDICHPAVNLEGNTLIFASNMEGGFGGMDLYVSYLAGDRWTSPENLGAEINTPENEVFPFLAEDGTLFFASDGHPGLGGLDIFSATANPSTNLWNKGLNIGTPFNSHYDDFGWVLREDEKEGYFTSNRLGGAGKDDIYKFDLADGFDAVQPEPLIPVTFCIYDKVTNKRLENAEVFVRKIAPKSFGVDQASFGLKDGAIVVNLNPVESDKVEYKLDLKSMTKAQEEFSEVYFTDRDGTFEMYMRDDAEYMLEVTKNGYLFDKESFRISESDNVDELCMGLRQRKIFYVRRDSNYVYDPNSPDDALPLMLPENLPDDQPLVMGTALEKETNEPMEGTTVSMYNRCTGEEMKLDIGKEGTFWMPLKCGCEFVIKARKDGYTGSNQVISLMDTADCRRQLIVDLQLNKGADRLNNPLRLGGNLLTETLKEGDVIELRNIFYDFNEHYIRPDARSDLNELWQLMNMFPSMVIELSSHTDSRGEVMYNQSLSNRRAQAAKTYLVERGIDPLRIRARGYGESRLLNECSDESECTELDHQRNRRTEVFIRQFDKSDYYKINYLDNQPLVVDPMPGN